jgi:hypothetical protein
LAAKSFTPPTETTLHLPLRVQPLGFFCFVRCCISRARRYDAIRAREFEHIDILRTDQPRHLFRFLQRRFERAEKDALPLAILIIDELERIITLARRLVDPEILRLTEYSSCVYGREIA